MRSYYFNLGFCFLLIGQHPDENGLIIDKSKKKFKSKMLDAMTALFLSFYKAL